VILILAAAYTFHQQSHVDRELCQSTVDNRYADRLQWITLRRFQLRAIATDPDPVSRAERTARIIALVDGVLRPIPALKCVDNKPVPKEGR
jgi:hypothetical protein